MKRGNKLGVLVAFLVLGHFATEGESMVVAGPRIQCPETVAALEEMLATDNWIPEDLRYKVQVLPDYFPENYTNSSTPIVVETNTTLRVSLREKTGSGRTLRACAIDLPPHRMERPGTYLNWKRVENAVTGGSLWYESESYQTKWYTLLHSLFSMGTEKLSKMKARYTFSVARPSTGNYTVLANMPSMERKPFEGKEEWVWEDYQESPPLWSDQVVILILAGGVKKVEFKDAGRNNRTISLYWRPSEYKPEDKEEQTRVNECILSWNAKLLTHFESRFGVEYPLNKLDLVATKSLGSRSTVDTAEKYLGFGRSHKMAHFDAKNGKCNPPTLLDARPWVIGTMQQWMGFVRHSWQAGYSESVMWGLMGYFLREGMSTVIGDSFEDEQLFTYTNARRKKRSRFAFNPSKPGLKEGAVLQMLEDVLTKPMFDTAIITNFMGKLKDTEATLEIADFYGAMDNIMKDRQNTTLPFPEGVTIKEIFQSWMETPGKPLVQVSLDKEDPSGVIFTQTVGNSISYDDHPRVRDRATPKVERNGTWIPLEILSGSESRSAWLSPNTSNTVQVKFTSNVQEADYFWVDPNITAYFRLLYDQPLTELVTKQLIRDPNAVSWRQRVKLVSEYFQFAKDNKTDIENVLQMLTYLENETSPGAWNAIVGGILGESWQLNIFGPAKQKLQSFVGSLIDKALARLGQGSLNTTVYNTEDTGSNVTTTRKELMTSCINVKTPGCTEYSKKLMTFWEDHPDLGNPFDRFGDKNDKAQCLALLGSLPGDKLYNHYVKMNSAPGEDNATTNGTSYCWALLCTGNEALLLDTLNRSLSNATTKANSECPSVDAIAIGREHHQLILPVFKMLKTAVLNGPTDNSQKMVDFLHAFSNDGLDDAGIKELDEFYVKYGKQHQIDWETVTYSNGEFNAGPLKDAYYFVKSTHDHHVQQAPGYSNRLREWLDKQGY